MKKTILATMLLCNAAHAETFDGHAAIAACQARVMQSFEDPITWGMLRAYPANTDGTEETITGDWNVRLSAQIGLRSETFLCTISAGVITDARYSTQ